MTNGTSVMLISASLKAKNWRARQKSVMKRRSV
ncbi:hypothetical protein SAMN05444172_9012 [Burkholderia sp. GAS332]|nr:hypothetical protein SAMN05444172_9012 [Burkholderia sp. GAS332]